ncbi:MAG: glyoxalase superfamily protein [Pseudomonadota bacterium]
MNHAADTKQRARALCNILKTYSTPIGYGQCLDILSKLNGCRDWNAQSAVLSKDTELSPLPVGWVADGDINHDYDVGVVPDTHEPSVLVAVIRSRSNNRDFRPGLATVMQSFDARHYVGSRIQLNALLAAKDCRGAVTLWLRVDDVAGERRMAFDNMERRKTEGALTGTSDFVERSIVVDVPEGAASIHFGFYLRGAGTAYATGMNLKRVDTSIETTPRRNALEVEPMNLDFSGEPSF